MDPPGPPQKDWTLFISWCRLHNARSQLWKQKNEENDLLRWNSSRRLWYWPRRSGCLRPPRNWISMNLISGTGGGPWNPGLGPGSKVAKRSLKKTYADLERENKRLSKEVGYLKEINKILKKSMEFPNFS